MADAEISVEARLQSRSAPPLGPLCWRLAARLATTGVRGRAHAAASDGLPELLRHHRVACTRASLDVRMRQRELHRRLLWAFDAIGARGQPAEVALRALYNHGPTSTRISERSHVPPLASQRTVTESPAKRVVEPELSSEEQQRLSKLEQAWAQCAPELRLDFEHWLQAEAEGAVHAHFDQQEHFSRRRDAPSKAHERAGLCCRNHVCLVAWFVVAFGLFIWLWVVQPENASFSYTPDGTELLRLHTLAKADAIANTNTSSMACVRSPFHLVPADELKVIVPSLWYALHTASVIAEAVCIAIMYSFLHNNVDGLLLRVVLRSAQVRALGLQLVFLMVHKVINLAVLVPIFGPFYLFTADLVIVYVCMCAFVVVTDAQRQKHPLTRRILVTILFIVTFFIALERTFKNQERILEEWIDIVALLPTHVCEGLEQGYILATAETSIFVSLVFTLGPAFRRIISDPEKVAFVKFTHHHSEVVAIHRARKFAARARKEAKLEVTRWRRQKYSRRVTTRLSAMADGKLSRVVY